MFCTVYVLQPSVLPMNQNISYHRTSSWKTLQGTNILLPSCRPYYCVHKVQSREVIYYHLSCSCYLVTELLRPLKCFCYVSSLKAPAVVYAFQFYMFLHYDHEFGCILTKENIYKLAFGAKLMSKKSTCLVVQAQYVPICLKYTLKYNLCSVTEPSIQNVQPQVMLLVGRCICTNYTAISDTAKSLSTINCKRVAIRGECSYLTEV